MNLLDIKIEIPEQLFEVLNPHICELRPAQEKAIAAGLLDWKNLLVCTPTASGKTLIAELAIMKSVLTRKGRGVYVVPLKALANEKYNLFRERYGGLCKVGIAIGDEDREDMQINDCDVVICTSEKLDSLIRHRAKWINEIGVVVIDEIHLLNDNKRGPTVEIVITLLRHMLRHVQLLGLSATIGNAQELASWMESELVSDDWRPVPLRKGIYFEDKIEFEDEIEKNLRE